MFNFKQFLEAEWLYDNIHNIIKNKLMRKYGYVHGEFTDEALTSCGISEEEWRQALQTGVLVRSSHGFEFKNRNSMRHSDDFGVDSYNAI